MYLGLCVFKNIPLKQLTACVYKHFMGCSVGRILNRGIVVGESLLITYFNENFCHDEKFLILGSRLTNRNLKDFLWYSILKLLLSTKKIRTDAMNILIVKKKRRHAVQKSAYNNYQVFVKVGILYTVHTFMTTKRDQR